MRKDLVKTIIGVIVIGLIVVATFLYGSKQRQDQIAKDDAAKQAQERQNNPVATTSTGSTDQAPSGGTAAVQQPAANALQNPTPATTPSPTPTPAPVVAPTIIPDTGSSSGIVAILPLMAIGLLYRYYLRGAFRLRAAFVSR